jgi:hypothetical protein
MTPPADDAAPAPGCDGITIQPTHIRDNDGKIVRTIG